MGKPSTISMPQQHTPVWQHGERKVNCKEPTWKKHLLDKLNSKLQSMLAKREVNARSFANVLWGVASLFKAEPGFLDVVPALVSYVLVVASKLEAQHVSNSLLSAAKLKDVAPDVLKMVPTLAAQIPVVVKSMNAQGVSNSLWSAATLKDVAPDGLETIPPPRSSNPVDCEGHDCPKCVQLFVVSNNIDGY